MMEPRFLSALLLWGLVLTAGVAKAHDLGLAQVGLQWDQGGNLQLRAKLPAKVAARHPQVPAGCRIEEHRERLAGPVTRIANWRIRCDRPIVDGDHLVLPWDREGALVTRHGLDGASDTRYVPARSGDLAIGLGGLAHQAPSAVETFGRYLLLGTEHILLGADHLAFVLGLCLIARGRQLLVLITGFTLGHSVTLALATLGWVQVPSLPVEACIALSIAFVARQAMLPNAESGHGFWLVAAFGLLHGLGFAGAFAETGIARQQLIPALISFNLGVELGQLLFVAGVLVLMRAARSLWADLALARRVSAFGLGSLAFFWTWERLAPLVIPHALAG